MADEWGPVTPGEIVRRLDALVLELRTMGTAFVRTELYESQRKDTGRRIGEMEKEVEQLKAARDADKAEADRRYRATVNMFIGGAISVAGTVFVMLLQLVAK